MRLSRSVRLLIFPAVLAFIVLSRPAQAIPRVEVRVADTSAIPHDTGYLNLYLTNRADSVAGFEITLLIDKPNLIGFLPSFDTSGTVMSGWEYLAYRLVDTPGIGIKYVGLISLNHPPNVHPGLAPSQQRRILLKVPFYAKGIPDTTTDRIATISLANSVADFGIATNLGQLIGLVIDTVYTPLCFHCTERDNTGNCLNWVSSSPPCDSSAVDTSLVNPRFDTSQVSIVAGSITLLADCHPIPLAGDVDGSGSVDSADLSFLRYYVQTGAYPLPRPQNADLNQDCCISWADATILEQYLAHPGTIVLPACNCGTPIRCCCSGRRGNLNNDRFGIIDASDLALMVTFLTGGTNSLPCSVQADFNGDGTANATDLAYLVSYLTTIGVLPALCP